MKRLYKLQSFLENIDSYRDRILFVFIKPFWPRFISPNHVTYTRGVIGIGIFILIFFLGMTDRFLILSLFFVGVLTDFIDGPVARGTNRVTEFGAMLDSATDKILLAPIAVYSLFNYHKWLLLVLILTEILNALAILFYKSKKTYIQSNIFAKIKMVLLSAVFIVILFLWPVPPPLFYFYILWLSIPFSFLGIIMRILELKNKTYETATPNL